MRYFLQSAIKTKGDFLPLTKRKFVTRLLYTSEKIVSLACGGLGRELGDLKDIILMHRSIV